MGRGPEPDLQGDESIESPWLYKTNADVLGGGRTVLTGPAFIDASNIGTIAPYAARGTRQALLSGGRPPWPAAPGSE